MKLNKFINEKKNYDTTTTFIGQNNFFFFEGLENITLEAIIQTSTYHGNDTIDINIKTTTT